MEDALVSQFVPEHHDGLLGAAARRPAHSQGHLVGPGAEAQRARAVGPQAAHALAPRTGDRSRRKKEEKEEESVDEVK